MSTTLARHWVPERSWVSDAGLVIAFSLFTGLGRLSRNR
jgi:hypothetical protein